MLRLFSVALGLLLLAGCTSYGVIKNVPQTEATSIHPYSIKARSDTGRNSDISLFLAFSGGGTRAAALSYGVLEELRDTTVILDGQSRRLLDEIDTISSVSGGSFTSAYFGLYGDRIFEDFRERFLVKDIEGKLIRGLMNPARLFSSTGRTEMAMDIYEKEVFQGATFEDMQREGAPLILINASDLGYGVRFTFVQEYFNLLCSDLSSFPVSRAVTASSAVPLLFDSVVVKNFHDCKSEGMPAWVKEAKTRVAGRPEMTELLKGLETYYKKDRRKYAHFVDGGITDNLGLRAMYEMIELSGGVESFLKKAGRKPPRFATVISINASTNPEPEMDMSNVQPSIAETIAAMSNVQLHRYNDATLELMQKSLRSWAEMMSTTERPVTPYFVQVGFEDIRDPQAWHFFNRIPTSFSLTEEQVDRLIQAGRELLRNNPDFQRLLADLGDAS